LKYIKAKLYKLLIILIFLFWISRFFIGFDNIRISGFFKVISKLLNAILGELYQTPDMLKDAWKTRSESLFSHYFYNFEESVVALKANFVANELVLTLCEIR